MRETIPEDEKAAQNTDRELWREEDSYYAPSIHVTAQGSIGINVGGTVYVKPVREWHSLSARNKVLEEALRESDLQMAEWKAVAGEFAEAHPRGQMNNGQIKHMVDRFLGWKLPENFNPDGGISFKQMSNENTPWPRKNEPVGTNLFDATQAEQMVRYMIEGLEDR